MSPHSLPGGLSLALPISSASCLPSALDEMPRNRAVSAIRSFTSISVVLEVIPLKYHEMGGGGKRAGSISWSRVMADVTLPLPPVQDSYSSREHGWRGRHTSLSTNMGSILQQPSNFLIKPVRPCLNLTCKRYCTKTRIRQHMRRPKGLAVFQGFTVWFFLFWSEKTWTDKTPDHQRNFQLLPAPLQLLALTLSQARLFLILLPEKSKKNIHDTWL